MSDYTVTKLDEIEEISDGRCPWRPVRHQLGITAFGVNAFTGKQVGDRIINEHDEAGEHDLQEELYLVHQGRARFELDGESVDAPAGTFVYVPPDVKRTAFAEEPGTTLVAVGGKPGTAYEPSGYELWMPLNELYQAGEYEQVIERGREAIEAHEYALPLYNLACAESLAGHKDDAIEHLRRAIESREPLRSLAREDSDFDAVRDEPAFQELVARALAMEARLEDVGSGLAPVSPGWFVVNVAEAAWLRNDAFGGRCVFESNGRVLADRPDLEPQQFEQLGFTLAVLEPGKPTGMYHAESDQEDFLVLAGTCLLVIEEEERELRAWDFVHCPPGTRHTFVGTGEDPCVIFMTGARTEDGTIVYPVSETARARGAGVETETPSPREAYAPFEHWRLGRPDAWRQLPWS